MIEKPAPTAVRAEEPACVAHHHRIHHVVELLEHISASRGRENKTISRVGDP